mgnify:CR=1 FL=1|jgi:hypothetical protein|tara:strand:+ start:25079 stop:25360 length:282 start_codon:yes stop_codon:yes gene_type:complete
MRNIIYVLPIILAACAASAPPVQQVASYGPPHVQLLYDGKVQQMSRNEVINAIQECEANRMRAVPMLTKRMISGMMSDIIVDVQCMPRFTPIW